MWFSETVLSKTSFLQIERWVVSSGKLPVCAVIYSKLGCESASYISRKVIMGVIQFRTSFIPEITCFNNRNKGLGVFSHKWIRCISSSQRLMGTR